MVPTTPHRFPVTRRHVLRSAVGGAAATLAGCFAFGTGCSRSYTLRLSETTDAETVEAAVRDQSDLHPIGADLVLTARDEGAATYRATRKPPVPERSSLELDGRYYDAIVEAVDETTTTGSTFDVESHEEVDEASAGRSVDFDDLPAHDQRSFVAGLGYPSGRKLEGTWGVSGTASIGYADRDAVESSVLVPDPEYEYVRYQGKYFRLEKTGTEPVAVTTYEIRLEAVADSVAEMAPRLREESGVVLEREALSEEERDVLGEAAGDGYHECVADSTPTHGLFERLRDASYARYEGTWYAVDLFEAVV